MQGIFVHAQSVNNPATSTINFRLENIQQV
jgi:hypothetical protein